MDYVTLGSTGITVNKNGFGAIPIQRISESESGFILVKAYHSGITFIDTARGYTDSEKKIGLALSGVREKIYIATKTPSRDTESFWKDLGTSLEMLKTDYIDVYQFHNPTTCPKPGDGTGMYEAMLEAKTQGKIRHIGITNHRLDIAKEAAESGLYEIIQYPVSYLSNKQELDFVKRCADLNIGILAMKALSGGLISDSAAAYAYLAQFENVLPIWGIQFEWELDEFVSYQNNPPVLDEKAKQVIAHDVAELSGEFCRACGYCLPCPVNIAMPISARMLLLMRRMPASQYLGDDFRNSMIRVDDCIDCGHCKEHCPYGLDAPKLAREAWAEYKKLL